MKIIYICFLFFLSACVYADFDIKNTQVLKKGTDTDASSGFCQSFSLSNKQVSVFFKRSREVKIREFHDYDYLPCYVKGSLIKSGTRCEFSIRAGGTAQLVCDNKTGYLYVCDTCDDLLRDSE